MLLAGLVFASCADVYDGDEQFSSSVQNSQMKSPAEEAINIEATPDGATQIISWPVIEGAGGYRVTLKDVTDPTNQVVLADSIIDGCSLSVGRAEDSNYELSILTLGNSRYNNTDAAAATLMKYTTFLPSMGVIPAGSDIKEWFDANPIPEGTEGDNHVFDLEAGAEYTLNGELDFGLNTVTLRTPSTLRAKVTYGEKGNFYTNAGLNLKNLILDCSAQTSSSASVISLCKEPNEAILGLTGKDYYNIMDPITIQNCDIDGVNAYLFYDSNKKYCTQNFLIKNSVIHLTTTSSSIGSNALVNAYAGGIAHFSVEGSTIWSTTDLTQKYFLRYNNSFREDRVFDTDVYADNTVSIDYKNSTFYKVCEKEGQMGNYSGITNRAATSIGVVKSIFVQCGSGQVPRRIINSYQNAVTYNFQYNTYWWEGASETGYNTYDKSGTVIDADPAFADPENGIFTVGGAEQIAMGCGDPRWLE